MIDMTLDLENIKETCSIIEDEISVLQQTLQEHLINDHSYSPMITFFTSPDTRALAVVPPNQPSFQDTLVRMSEIFYIYSPLASHCCVISIDSTIKNDQGSDIDCFHVFVISEEQGYVIMLPYSKDSSNNLTWHSEDFTAQNILDTEFQGQTKEMINLFYTFTHLNSPPFTVNECLSYLSHVGAAILVFDSFKINYYNSEKQDRNEIKT